MTIYTDTFSGKMLNGQLLYNTYDLSQGNVQLLWATQSLTQTVPSYATNQILVGANTQFTVGTGTTNTNYVVLPDASLVPVGTAFNLNALFSLSLQNTFPVYYYNSILASVEELITVTQPAALPNFGASIYLYTANQLNNANTWCYAVISADGNVDAFTTVSSSTLDITPNGNEVTIDLQESGVTAGVYPYPTSITVDEYGIVTNVEDGSAPVAGVATLASAASTINVSSPSGNVNIDLPAVDMIVPIGGYDYPTNIEINNYGIVIGVTEGSAPVTGITSSTLNVSNPTGNVDIELPAAGTAGTYAYPTSLTVNQYGITTAVTEGSAPDAGVTSIESDTLDVSQPEGDVTVNLLAQEDVAGVYAYPTSVTVNQYGIITDVEAGSAPEAGVLSISSSSLDVTPSTGVGVVEIEIPASAAEAGTYDYPTVVEINGAGIITAIAAGDAPVTAISSNTLAVDPETGVVDIELLASGVTSGDYPYPTSVSVNEYGIVTAISQGSAPEAGVTSISSTSLTVTPSAGTGDVTIEIPTSAAEAGNYNYPSSVEINSYGAITTITGGDAPVIDISSVTLSVDTYAGSVTIDMPESGVTSGDYPYPTSVSVNEYGIVTAISQGSAPEAGVASIASTTLTVTPSAGTGDVTINLPASPAEAGNYNYPSSVEINASGIIVAITEGDAPVSGVTSISSTNLTVTPASGAVTINMPTYEGLAGIYDMPTQIALNDSGAITQIFTQPQPATLIMQGVTPTLNEWDSLGGDGYKYSLTYYPVDDLTEEQVFCFTSFVTNYTAGSLSSGPVTCCTYYTTTGFPYSYTLNFQVYGSWNDYDPANFAVNYACYVNGVI